MHNETDEQKEIRLLGRNLTKFERALIDAAESEGQNVGASNKSASQNDCTPTGYCDFETILIEALKEAKENE